MNISDGRVLNPILCYNVWQLELRIFLLETWAGSIFCINGSNYRPGENKVFITVFSIPFFNRGFMMIL